MSPLAGRGNRARTPTVPKVASLVKPSTTPRLGNSRAGCSHGRGVDGRPSGQASKATNRLHGGGTDSFAQATLLDLYDIDRSRAVLQEGTPSDWSAFDAFYASDLAGVAADKIAVVALRCLVPPPRRPRNPSWQNSPRAWVTFEPVCLDHLVNATTAVFRRPMRPDHMWDEADCVLVLDGDPLGTDADATGNARGWAAKRTPDSHGHMSRVYAFESIPSVTGANADERHTVSAATSPRWRQQLKPPSVVVPEKRQPVGRSRRPRGRRPQGGRQACLGRGRSRC